MKLLLCHATSGKCLDFSWPKDEDKSRLNQSRHLCLELTRSNFLTSLIQDGVSWFKRDTSWFKTGQESVII